MKKNLLLRAIAMGVTVLCALVPNAKASAGSLCSSGASCGTCCYGDYDSIVSCCKDNGCTAQCELITSFCCPGVYQIEGCNAT